MGKKVIILTNNQLNVGDYWWATSLAQLLMCLLLSNFLKILLMILNNNAITIKIFLYPSKE